jgi:class 3 adenylate cyclase
LTNARPSPPPGGGAIAPRDAVAKLDPQFGYADSLQLRIGICTGPVIAGVIGQNKFIYDLWGDLANTASRMESQGEPGRTQVAATTYEKAARAGLGIWSGDFDMLRLGARREAQQVTRRLS